MGMVGRFVGKEPELCFRDGRVSVTVPAFESDAGAPLKIGIRCPLGTGTAGFLPHGDGPGISSPAFVSICGISPLDGFSVLIDGQTIFELPRTDAVCFDSDGRPVEVPEGLTTLVRRPGTGPEIADPVRTTTLDGVEVVEYYASGGRRFEISKPSLRFRDGVSYVYVARYIGLPGDGFKVSIKGDFGCRDLGIMPSRTADGACIASGTEFRLTDLGISVLDGFDILIDGRDVFGFPRRDMLVFTDRGTVTAFPVGRAVAVSRGNVRVESDAKCIEELTDPSGIVCRTFVREGPISFKTEVLDEPPDDAAGDAPATEAESVPEDPEPLEDAAWCDEPEYADDQPETDPYPHIPPGSFIGLTPRMALVESGKVRKVCVLIPEYRPRVSSPTVTVVRNGERINMGALPTGRWITKETLLDLQSRGVDPLETFSIEVDGDTVFSTRGTNALFFTAEGTRITKPRGRVIAVHRPELRLGVRGTARCRMVSSETRDGLVYDEAELGAKGVLYNMNVERRRPFQMD